jgi:ankyrin repeat protein
MAGHPEQVFNLSSSKDDKSVQLKELLEAHPGVDVNLHQDEYGRRSLYFTALWGHAGSTRLLIDANADLEARSKKGWTPLNAASANGNLDCVQVLIDRKADVKTVYFLDGTTPAHMTALNGHPECLELLINANADPEARGHDGLTPLINASKKGNLDCIQVLIDSKADVNTATDYGDTPAYRTASNGHPKCLKLLIDAKADLEARVEDGMTPLNVASHNGNVDCLQVLIDSKADVENVKDNGFTPAHMTVSNGHAKCLGLLIDAKAVVPSTVHTPFAFIDHRSHGGLLVQDALARIACREDHLACLQLLVDNKADLSGKDDDGLGSVYWAIRLPYKNRRTHPLGGCAHRVPGMPFAVLSCNTDINTGGVTQATVTAHINEYKQIHNFIDECHSVTKHALNEDVVVDKRVGRRGNGIFHEPLEQVLLYLGLSMKKNQTVNASIDGAAVKRVLMPGHPTNANLWFELYQRRPH